MKRYLMCLSFGIFLFVGGAHSELQNENAVKRPVNTLGEMPVAQKNEVVALLKAELQSLKKAKAKNQNEKSLGLLVEPGAPMLATSQSIDRRIELYEKTAAILASDRVNDFDEADLLEVQEVVVLFTRLSYVWCKQGALDADRIAFWEEDLEGFAKRHSGLPSAVGALQLSVPISTKGDRNKWKWVPFNAVATAFLVAPDAAVTNFHAIAGYVQEFNGTLTLNAKTRLRIDFGSDFINCPDKAAARVAEVIDVIVDKDLDLAILKVSGYRLPTPLETGVFADAKPGDVVAVVGFPLANARIPRRDQQRVFGRPDGTMPFKVRRIAPGEVLFPHGPSAMRDLVLHDASTLGGNSGSIVVNLTSGAFLGVHQGGVPYKFNQAIPARKVNQFLTEKGVIAATNKSLTNLDADGGE